MKRKLFVLFWVIIFAFVNVQADGINGLWLVKKSGEKIGLAFNQKPVIRYFNDKFILSLDNVETEISLAEIDNFYFADDVTAVNDMNISKANEVIDVDNSVVNFTGFKAGAKVFVYNSAGLSMWTGKIGQNGSLQLPIENFARGLYFVKAGSAFLKIRK